MRCPKCGFEEEAGAAYCRLCAMIFPAQRRGLGWHALAGGRTLAQAVWFVLLRVLIIAAFPAALWGVYRLAPRVLGKTHAGALHSQLPAADPKALWQAENTVAKGLDFARAPGNLAGAGATKGPADALTTLNRYLDAAIAHDGTAMRACVSGEAAQNLDAVIAAYGELQLLSHTVIASAEGGGAPIATYVVKEDLKNKAKGVTYSRRNEYRLEKTEAGWCITRVVYGH